MHNESPQKKDEGEEKQPKEVGETPTDRKILSEHPHNQPSTREIIEGCHKMRADIEHMLENANRLRSFIRNRAPYRGLGIADKIQEGDTYRKVERLLRNTFEETKVYLKLMNGIEGNTGQVPSGKQFTETIARPYHSLRQIVTETDLLWREVIFMKRKVSDFYNGRESEDEEFLRGLVSLIREMRESAERATTSTRRQGEKHSI